MVDAGADRAGRRPGRGTGRELAAAARRIGVGWTVAQVRQQLDDGGLVGLVDELLLAAPGGPQRRLLVVADQFEELLIHTIGQDFDTNDVDVTLATTWKQLWTTSHQILPLAFHSFKGGAEEAAAALLLNHMTRTVFGQPATYLADSLLALGTTDPEITDQLDSDLQRVLDILVAGNSAAVIAAYRELTDVIKGVSPRRLRAAHPAHTGR
ncbi:MAG: hypothetical protein LC799_28335, partial [Actinobacteria bacterium]|nr:hypothetical protein [Actinomycetota bacterium]